MKNYNFYVFVNYLKIFITKYLSFLFLFFNSLFKVKIIPSCCRVTYSKKCLYSLVMIKSYSSMKELSVCVLCHKKVSRSQSNQVAYTGTQSSKALSVVIDATWNHDRPDSPSSNCCELPPIVDWLQYSCSSNLRLAQWWYSQLVSHAGRSREWMLSLHREIVAHAIRALVCDCNDDCFNHM